MYFDEVVIDVSGGKGGDVQGVADCDNATGSGITGSGGGGAGGVLMINRLKPAGINVAKEWFFSIKWFFTIGVI